MCGMAPLAARSEVLPVLCSLLGGREGGGVGSHGPGALSAAGLCERGLRPCAVRGGRAAGKGNGRQAL